MKTLLESIFDDNLVEKEIELGDLYKLSDAPHHCSFSNSVDGFIKIFKKDKLKQISKNLKWVDKSHSFVSYWDKYMHAFYSDLDPIASIIDIIFRAPMTIFISRESEKKFKDYIEPYIEKSCYKKLDIYINKIGNRFGDPIIELDICDDIHVSRSHILRLAFIKK